MVKNMKEFEELENKRKKCPYFVYGGIGGIALSMLLMFVSTASDIPVLPGFCFITLFSCLILIIIGNVQFKKSKEILKRYT